MQDFTEREFVEPFHLVMLKPVGILGVDRSGHCEESAEQVRFEVHKISDLHKLARAMQEMELVEGTPLVVQFAVLQSLGLLTLKEEDDT